MELVNCDFCGSSNYRPKYQVRTSKYHPDYLQAISIVGPNPPESFTVVECRDCGLMFLNPRYSARELKEAYPDEQYSDRSGFFSGSILLKRSGAIPEIKFRGETVDSVKNRARMVRIMQFKNGGRILDIGCCNGSFLALLERNGWETYGVDFSSAAIENAQQVFGQNRTFCGELLDAEYPTNFFDVVTLYDTIEHLANPRTVLEEVQRISKTDALLVIQTNDMESLNARFFPRSMLFPAQHLYYYRKRDLVQLLAGNGFDLVEEEFATIGLFRFGFYCAMHWWTHFMVQIHKRDRRRWKESLRRLFVRTNIIFDEGEMLERLKKVGANNFPAYKAGKTFYFLCSDK